MKKSLYILLGAALLAAMTSCEPKFEYSRYSYVVLNETTVSVAEDVGTLSIGVTAYSLDGKPYTEVEFEVVDGAGDNGAKNGVDFTVVSPLNGVLVFEGDDTAYINFSISDANVGIYTGRKQFTVNLIGVTNGYTVGGAYSTTVYITDNDKNLDGDSVDGTYNANALVCDFNTYKGVEDNWDLTIIVDETNDELVYIDGLVPYVTGMFSVYGTSVLPYGYLDNEGTEIHVPSQVVNFKLGGYYLGYTPCVQYSGTDWYYSQEYPELVFTLDAVTGEWTSNYGVLLMGCDTQDFSSVEGLFDAVAPVITLTKID